MISQNPISRNEYKDGLEIIAARNNIKTFKMLLLALISNRFLGQKLPPLLEFWLIIIIIVSLFLKLKYSGKLILKKHYFSGKFITLLFHRK